MPTPLKPSGFGGFFCSRFADPLFVALTRIRDLPGDLVIAATCFVWHR
jgi:hypothetical protein